MKIISCHSDNDGFDLYVSSNFFFKDVSPLIISRKEGISITKHLSNLWFKYVLHSVFFTLKSPIINVNRTQSFIRVERPSARVQFRLPMDA